MRVLSAVSAILLATVACAGVGERTDTSKVLPVNDINAVVTTPPPPPPMVTKLSIMDSVPPGGICTVKRYRANADQAREVYYETNTPPRTYVLEIGKGLRLFPASTMDIRASQNRDGLEETENVYVGFTPQGKVAVGTRRYTATSATSSVNDRMQLEFADSAKLLAFANTVLGMCDPGR